MKNLKYFNEAEIYVGTMKHLNPLNAVNDNIFDEIKLIDYECENCNNKFMNKVNLKKCPVCFSKNLITLP